MIKAQRDLYGEIENISIREELSQELFRHPSLQSFTDNDYTRFMRTVYFWLNGVSYTVCEFKKSKWYKKQPHYRPTGKSTYELIITTWDENGRNPTRIYKTFETLTELEKEIKNA